MDAATVRVIRAVTLAPKLARRAYALVQISNPSIDFERWTNHVRACAKVRSGSSGLMAMVDERDYVHGIFAWSLVPDVSHNNSLRISNIIVADVPGLSLAQLVLLTFHDLAASKSAGIEVIMALKEVGTLCRNAALNKGFTLAGELLAKCVPDKSGVGDWRASGGIRLE